jgi:hypothetical protein
MLDRMLYPLGSATLYNIKHHTGICANCRAKHFSASQIYLASAKIRVTSKIIV